MKQGSLIGLAMALCLPNTLAAQIAEPPPEQSGAVSDDSEKPSPDDAHRPAQLDAEGQLVVTGLNRLAGDMHGRIQIEQSGDFAISSVSISTAFGMAYAGARGETAAEIARVLHYPTDVSDFHRANSAVLASLQLEGRGRTMSVNNALWVQQGYRFRPDYRATVNANYQAGINPVDYAADPQAARLKINRWVESKTNDRIKDLLSPPDVTKDTRSVLVNTVYFKADWAKVFEKSATRDEDFTLEDGVKTVRPLMHQTNNFRYAEHAGVQMIALPYRGHETEMVVILPKRGKLAKLEAGIAEKGFEPFLAPLDGAQFRDVILTLPKFKIEKRFELQEDLKAMGMTTAFSNLADFSGTTEPGEWPLMINKVIHQVFVEVEEKGTEAAAATAITMDMIISGRRGPPPPPPVVFKADHPFLFLIRDARTKAIVFSGRLAGKE